jgi:hypothetical protein
LKTDKVVWKKLLSVNGVECCECCAASADAVFGGGHLKELRSVISSGECFSLGHLAVNGDDMLSIGLSGAEVGEALYGLLEHVMETPADNDRDTLMALIKSKR